MAWQDEFLEEHADEVLCSLARRCGRKSWNVLWNSEGQNFHLLFLDNDLEAESQFAMLDMVQCIFEESLLGRDFRFFWSFAMFNKRGQRVSSPRMAKSVSRNATAIAALSSILEDLSRGYSFGFFTSIFSHKPTVFLEAGSSLEEIVMSLQLREEGLILQKA